MVLQSCRVISHRKFREIKPELSFGSKIETIARSQFIRKSQKLHYYKSSLNCPVRFDSRDTRLDEGTHWANDTVLGGRAYFRFDDEPAKLTLDDIKESDSGLYVCRVDFKLKPTRNTKVNLTVISISSKLSQPTPLTRLFNFSSARTLKYLRRERTAYKTLHFRSVQ